MFELAELTIMDQIPYLLESWNPPLENARHDKGFRDDGVLEQCHRSFVRVHHLVPRSVLASAPPFELGELNGWFTPTVGLYFVVLLSI